MPFTPSKAADACIRRSRRLIALSNQPLNDSRVKNDLRRAAIVMAVTGIDTYMHWLVYARVSGVRASGDLPKSLTKLDVPFADLAALVEATVRGRKSGVDTRPWVQVKRALQQRLFKETFQTYIQVEQAFCLAGIDKGWSKVAQELSTKAEDIKTRLGALVHRRNQIVHEGDIRRAARPRTVSYNDIDHDTVVKEVDWVGQLLKAMGKIA